MFKTKHSEQISLDGLQPNYFYLLAKQAILALEWELFFFNEDGMVAISSGNNGKIVDEIKIVIEDDQASLVSICISGDVIDFGRNKTNLVKLIEAIEHAKQEMDVATLEERSVEIQKEYVISDDGYNPIKTPVETFGLKDFFIPTKDFFITPIVIYINVFLFVLMVFSGVGIMDPNSTDLVNWGANYRSSTLDGGWWRLLTACFLHIGILHLLLNMYALVYIGVILEPLLGKVKFASAYLLTGVLASFASLWWHNNTVSAGASGAIFGMYGVFLALLMTNSVNTLTKKAFMSSVLIFVFYNLINGLSKNSSIDNAAHIGGLLSGVLVGFALVPSIKQPDNSRLEKMSIGGLTVSVVVLIALFIHKIPDDMGRYFKTMDSVSKKEELAVQVYMLPDTLSTETYVACIDDGLKKWHECDSLIKSLKAADYSEEIVKRNVLLLQYIDLRTESFNLLKKRIVENTYEYDSLLSVKDLEVEKMIKQLSQ